MTDGKKFIRLGRAVASSYRKIEPFRLLTAGLVREYAGPAYGENAEEEGREKFVNLMNQAVDAYLMLLSAALPQVLVSSPILKHSGFAEHFRVAINNLLKQIDFGATHKEWVMNAFFCMGVLKIHLADSGQTVAADNILMDPGMPFASAVALDNFVYDTSARKAEEAKFMGDMYRIPFESLEDPNLYDQAVVKRIGVQPTSKTGCDGDRLEKISTGQEVDDDELEPMVDLADIYVARERKVYTFVVTNRHDFTLSAEPVAEFDWTGTKRGPYRILGFGDIPENIMTVGPAVQLAALDNLVNNLMTKQARQAQRQKENPVYTPAGTESAKNLSDSFDGEWLQVQDPREVSVVRQGGPDQANQQFMFDAMKLFDRMAGNLPAMLGLGTSADTVGQERLIHASGSRKEGKMQEVCLRATTSVIEELAFLLWLDDFNTIPGQVSLDGFPDYRAQSDWVPGDREGEFKDYQFEIDVYSMSYQSPAERVMAINKLIGEVYAPMLQQLAEQGGAIDFSRLTSMYSDLLNLPRLKEIVVFTSPIDDMGAGPSVSGGGKPSHTERRYVRQNANADDGAVPDAGNWQSGGAKPSLEAVG